MNVYLVNVVGLIVQVFLGAFVARYAIARIAGFKPLYKKVLVSSVVAYSIAFAVVNVVIFLLSWAGVADSQAHISSKDIVGFNTVAVWGALTCAHVKIVRSDTGAALSKGKAMLVSLCQVFGAIILAMLVLFLLLIIKRLFVP